MTYVWISLLLILSYLLGSIPFGLIIGKSFKGIDVREHGSKNMGATNCVRVLGIKLGMLVLILDMLKAGGLIALLRILYYTDVIDLIHISDINIGIFYGLLAVIGNVFPIFAKFKGGKAVAATGGVMLALNPAVAGLSVLVFAIVVLLCGVVSLGSVLAALTCLTLSILDIEYALFTPGVTWESYYFQMIGVGIIILFLIWKHIPNMKRLFKGEERSFNIGLRKIINKRKTKKNED